MRVLVLVILLMQGGVATAQNSGLIKLGARDALLGWEAVGRVSIGNRGYCTGVLIATDLVLTAAHCVYDKMTGQAEQENALRFQAGWRDGKAIAERGIAAIAAHPKYNPKAGVTLENLKHDAALLKLDQAVPAGMAAPFVLHSGAKTGQRVSVVSYGKGRDTALSWQRDCGLLGRGDGILGFDCDVTFGSSGAPVFVREGQRARILTLVSSGGSRNGMKVAYGMELPPVISELKRVLRARGPIRSTVSVPQVKRLRVGVMNGSTGAKFVTSKPGNP